MSAKFSFRNKTTTGVPPRRRGEPTLSAVPSRAVFQRNRTLTGSSSSQVASSGELTAALKSPRAHAHHLTSLRRRIVAYFIIVLFVAVILYILVSQLTASLVVRVSGVDLLSANDAARYSRAIDDYFAARPAERLRFLTSHDALLSHMQALDAEVGAIQIEPGESLGEALITVTPRTPIARWSINGSNQFVDRYGVVFTRNYYPVPELRIVDNSGLSADASQNVTSQRFLGFVGLVIGLAKDNGLTVDRVTIPPLTAKQLNLKVRGVSPYFKLSVDRSAGEQVEDMSRIVTFLKRKNIAPTYVDVRIEGKAFYR